MQGLDKSFEDVKEFHLAFKHPAPEVPEMQHPLNAIKRGNWITQEVKELTSARTLVDQADAYLDIIYFAVGGLVELGIKPEALWDIVHNANMKKLHDGKVVYHPDGKIKKPADWVAPEPLLEIEVNKQIEEAKRVGE